MINEIITHYRNFNGINYNEHVVLLGHHGFCKAFKERCGEQAYPFQKALLMALLKAKVPIDVVYGCTSIEDAEEKVINYFKTL